MMNRRERRAAKAKARHHRIDPITVGHEAGHAIGRYLVAPDMGFPEDEMITDIVVYNEDERPDVVTSIDGRVKLETLAVCNGPTFSAELDALVPAAISTPARHYIGEACSGHHPRRDGGKSRVIGTSDEKIRFLHDAPG